VRARSTSPDEQRSPGQLDVDELDQQLGRLSQNVVEAKRAASSRLIAAGQRISEYENAAIYSSPRQNSRPVLGFKVTNGSRSGGVQLTDFPNGSSRADGCHQCCSSKS
jgi:hypothetical protein